MYSKIAGFIKWQLFSLFEIYWNIYLSKKIKKTRPEKPRLFWGTYQIITNKYFSEAMKAIGYNSKTIVRGIWAINKKDDFDMLVKDIYPRINSQFIHIYYYYKTLKYIAENFDIIHTAYCGIISGELKYFKKEYNMLKKSGCKIVVIPYGSDYWQYSKMDNIPLRHGLLADYPGYFYIEDQVKSKVDFLQKNADCIIPIFQTTAIGKWDVNPFCNYIVNGDLFTAKKNYNKADGKAEPVTIVHAPNHRGMKGTNYIINVINELKLEGYKINFILIEKTPNDIVKQIFRDKADILVDQLMIGYGISVIEGLLTGLPVLCPVGHPDHVFYLDNYSYLKECPVVSVNHTNLKENLIYLIQNPELREQLGRAGRKYAEKYHSYKTAQYLFSKIYDKIWYGKEVDLMELYNPLNPASYNNQSQLIQHHLISHQIKKT
jgi:glycosyltransferase involved in cell wall biosynthesis